MHFGISPQSRRDSKHQSAEAYGKHNEGDQHFYQGEAALGREASAMSGQTVCRIASGHHSILESPVNQLTTTRSVRPR